MNRQGIVAGCVLLPSLLAACNALVGLRDIEEGELIPGDVSQDGGRGEGGVQKNDDGGRDEDASAPPSDAGSAVLDGTLHFLQGGGSVTLASRNDSVTVTDNGAFQLPVHGAMYEVTVTAQPTGQHCWVVNGAGATATPAVGLEVRCSVIKRSVGTATQASSLTTTAEYAALADVADITFETDRAASALLYLSVPSMTADANTGTVSQYRVAIFLDGSLHAEAVTRAQFNTFQNHTPVLVMSTPALEAGTHTVEARWRRVDGSNNVVRAATTPSALPISAELGAIVLDSVEHFDRVESSTNTTSTEVSTLNANLPIGLPDLSFTAAPAQPALLMASLPDVRGQATVSLRIDGTTAAFQRTYDNHTTAGTSAPTPMALRALAAGAHTVSVVANGHGGLDGTKAAYGTSAGTNDVKPAALRALLWSPRATFGSWQSTAPIEVASTFPNGFSQVPGSSITFTTSRPSKALVMLDVSRISAYSTSGEGAAEAAVFVGNAQGPAVISGRGGWLDDLRSNVCSRIGVVDLPAGTTTLSLRFYNYASHPTRAHAARFGAIVLE